MKSLTKQTIDDYVNHGIPPGGFVMAVLENNLMESFGRADIENRRDLFEICEYVYNEIPAPCHGSPEAVSKWLRSHAEVRK